MWFSTTLLVVLSTWALSTQAYDYSTAKLCTTKYGPKSTSAKTTSYALTISVTITTKFTTTPTSTITPPPQRTTTTTTSTATSTVVVTPTSTFTETYTATSTTTTTTAVTTDTTTTVTTTSSAGTTTVPTPAGFTALADAPYYFPKKRSLSLEAAVPAIRGRHVEPRTPTKTPACPVIGTPTAFSQYPQTVTCGALIVAKTTTTKTYTASTKATTTLPASTSTVTSTATTTVTTTSLAAPASTTTTTTASVTATATATSTTTNTVTQTVTAVQTSATVYAACSSNNVVNSANGGQAICGVYANRDSPTTNMVAVSDPVACCVQCQQSADCNGYAQYPGESQCYLFSNGQCDAASNYGEYYQTSDDIQPDTGYTIGNGPCGQIINGGEY